jgi:penicillin amidase
VRLAWLVAGLLFLAVLAAAAYVWRASPRSDGTLVLPGLKAEVLIERDAQGIPSIRAQSLEDALYGLGVVHAQDRLWQMEVHRRIGAGRLAEAFGAQALNNDRFLRALGVRRAAQAQWERASPASRSALQAYTDGVNAVLREALDARPPEFLVLGIQPEPWTPVDSLAWAVMMAWDLGGNWTTEMQRLRLSGRLPRERIDEFLPPYPGDAPLAVRDYPALYRELGLNQGAVRQAWLRLPEIAPPSGVEGTGSNNWVLAGSRTTTGKPLLANDPHLGLNTPALWYFARLQAPGLDVAGATMPGLPGVVLGQNGRLAWGFTNTGPDVQDLYIEEVVPTEPARYRTPQGTAPFEVAQEVIRVRGGPEVRMQVRSTRHGPVISDAGTLADALGARHVLALRWTALDTDNDAMAASLAMMRAQSVGELRAGGAGVDRTHAEHRRGRCRRHHRLRRGRPRAAAQPRQRPARPGPCTRLGCALRLGGLGARWRDAAREGSRARLDRHRQPARPRRGLSALHHERLVAAVSAAAHRAAPAGQAPALDRGPRAHAG